MKKKLLIYIALLTGTLSAIAVARSYTGEIQPSPNRISCCVAISSDGID